MEYFALPFQLAGKTRYLLYFCNDHDGVVTDRERRILSFDNSESLLEMARKKKWKVKSALPALDVDQVKAWIRDIDGEKLDSPLLYRTWNILGDIATSVGRADDFTGYHDDAMSVHEELFWGCNLPGASPSDRPYEARLMEEGVATLKNVFETGVKIFIENLKDFP